MLVIKPYSRNLKGIISFLIYIDINTNIISSNSTVWAKLRKL